MYAYRELSGGGTLCKHSGSDLRHRRQIDVERKRIMQKSFGELCKIQKNSRRCKTHVQN